MGNHHVREPYKPYRKCRLLGAMFENDPNILQTQLGLPVKVDDVLRHRQKQPFPRENCILHNRKKVFQNPYKQCRL